MIRHGGNRPRDAFGRFLPFPDAPPATGPFEIKRRRPIDSSTTVPAEGMVIGADKGGPQIRRKMPGCWDQAKRDAFLDTLAATANVLEACRAVDMVPAGAYQLRKRDPEFRAQWKAALTEAYQQLELTLLDRSINGHERPVFYGGEMVGKIQHYPDGLAIKLLAHHRAIGRTIDSTGPSPEALAEAQARVLARFDAARLIEARDGDD